MHSKRPRRSLAAIAAIASAALLAAGSGTASAGSVTVPEAPTVGTTAESATRTVAYHGYAVDVPASWPVIDLAEEPETCVRFDRPAVYLGTPGEQMTCPAGLIGRTSALLIEPLEAPVFDAAAATTAPIAVAEPDAAAPAVGELESVDATFQVAVETAGVLVTAAHDPNTETLVHDILAGARLTDGGEPQSLEDLAAESAAAGPGSKGDVGTLQVDPQPGTYTGLGFDACTAPSQSAMNAWLNSSFRAIGIYISGSVRACAQPNLTASWVANQTANGWRLLSLHVGAQAPQACTSRTFRLHMSTNTSTARSQGVQAANESMQAAQNLGIPQGSVLYNNMEHYNPSSSCTAAVMSFLAGWTDTLHGGGYKSGVYSSVSSGISDLAANYNNSNYARPDHIFYGWWNGQADSNTEPYFSNSLWPNGRIHQYRGDHNETHGGVTINIDSDYFDVAGGGPAPQCASVTLNFSSYPTVGSGAEGSRVSALQCLLKSQGHYDPEPPSGTFDAETQAGVEAFQAAVGLPVTGEADSSTWTALLSAGTTPLLRNGSSGAAVTRLQRALVAARGQSIGIDGLFGPETEGAVRSYQDTRDLDVDGIVGPQTWGALQSGK